MGQWRIRGTEESTRRTGLRAAERVPSGRRFPSEIEGFTPTARYDRRDPSHALTANALKPLATRSDGSNDIEQKRRRDDLGRTRVP